jgi:peptidoglycan/xylan/chitin deacetylase (PgdA/CDA1 family)
MFFHRTPWLVQKLYPNLIWSRSTSDKSIFLTFDDGPIPDLTEFIIESLRKHEAKATFFCVGDNLKKYKHIAEKAIAAGHKLANHTYNHIPGWSTENGDYFDNIAKCELELKQLGQQHRLFRPPYGKIKRSQISQIHQDFKIIMWDVLSGDYRADLSSEKCLKNSIDATKNGSITLFHDNLKAEKNLKYTLPRYLDHFSNLGYQFRTL